MGWVILAFVDLRLVQEIPLLEMKLQEMPKETSAAFCQEFMTVMKCDICFAGVVASIVHIKGCTIIIYISV